MLRRRTTSTLRSNISRAVLEAVEARRLLAVNIVFDYSKDVNGFFTDPARQALLQQAADEITDPMQDELAAIMASGSNTFTITFNDPGTGTPATVVDPTIPADTIIIYAGAYDLPAGVLGIGGAAGYTSTGSTAFNNNIKGRGQAGALRTKPTDYSPFAGSIAFDTAESYFFGADASGIGASENDFLSVAEHELTHVLGITAAPSFQRSVRNGEFLGANSVALYGGPVPLESDGKHFAEGTNVGGVEALMDPSLTVGTRKLISPLDFAALADTGWDLGIELPPTVTVTATDKTAEEPSGTGTFLVTRDGPTSGALVVNLAITGTATYLSDYKLLVDDVALTTAEVTIPDGEESVEVVLQVIDDPNIEANETATLNAGVSANFMPGVKAATVTIIDDDLARLQASRSKPAVIDVSTGGIPSDLGAQGMQISADGRYVSFISNSTNLVGSPLTTYFQVYRRDMIAGVTTLLSGSSNGKSEANNNAVAADINASGRFVAFETTASDVVGGKLDRNVVSDVYFKDALTGEVILVSRNSAGAVGGELLAISDDGDQVLFSSSTIGSAFVKGLVDQNGSDDLFVWSHRTGRYTCVSTNSGGMATGNRPTVSNDAVGDASFSGDGRFVVFASRASDLVNGVTDGNTFQYDVFVRNLANKSTEYVSISNDPIKGGDIASGNADITQDGRYIVFRSSATNLVSGIADTNAKQDLFVRDRQTGTTRLISVKSGGGVTANGAVGVPDITADGRYVVFTSTATDMLSSDTNDFSDAYLADLTNNTLKLITVNSSNNGSGNAATTEVKITDDGQRVVFASYASNLEGDFDKLTTDHTAVYSRNLFFNRNSVLSFDSGGNPSGDDASNIILSADGTRAGFASSSQSLVTGDRNNVSDVFLSILPGRESAFIDNKGKLTVLGSPVDDAINVQRVSSKIVVRRNSERLDFKVTDVLSIDIIAGDGNDLVTLGTNLMGSYVSGGSGDDIIRGGGGNDRINGGQGRDQLFGGGGDDRVDGGKGNDQIFGEGDDDFLLGGDGNDHLFGSGGKDRLNGGAGNDTLEGGNSGDRFYADDGYADLIFGGDGTDTGVSEDSLDILNSIEA